MSEMTNPMNALVQLQFALDKRIVKLHACDIHREIWVIADSPNGTPRYTYVKMQNGIVQSVALFALTGPVKDTPCFQLGCATIESIRGHGLATEAARKGIDELQSGLKRNGVSRFYVEAVISTSNVPSNKLARRLLSDTPVSCTDVFSGQPALQYLRIIE